MKRFAIALTILMFVLSSCQKEDPHYMISFPDSEDPGLISVSAAKGSGSFTVKTEANFDYGTTIICNNGNWLSLVKSSLPRTF